MPVGFPVAVGALLASNVALATEVQGEFLGLSFTGDGSTPSAMDMFAVQQRNAAAARAAASVSDRGDASWSYAVPLPPALLAPSVGLSYSSAGAHHTFVSRGCPSSPG